MTIKCLDCGYVGEPAYPSPKITKHGEDYKKVPVCAKCKSGHIMRVG